MTKPGGLMFHFVPVTGSWPGHCDYWYTLEFFEGLFALADYRTVMIEQASDLIDSFAQPRDICVAAAIKEVERPFIDETRFAPLYDHLRNC